MALDSGSGGGRPPRNSSNPTSSTPKRPKRGTTQEEEVARYEQFFNYANVQGIGQIRLDGSTPFATPESWNRSTAAIAGSPTSPLTYTRWGAGVPIAEQEDTPIFVLGPNGERVPVSGEDKVMFADGNVQLPNVYGAALDPSRPGSVNSLWAADVDGNVVYSGSPEQDVKFQQQKAKALEEIVAQWTQDNDGAVPSTIQMDIMEQQAEQRAMSAVSFLIGGNPDNYPKSVAPQGAEAYYAEGQILPNFIGGGGINGRPIDLTEAQALNWIVGSESVTDTDRDALMRSLFDPMVPDEQKQQIVAQVTGAINQAAANAETVEDGFDWTWNPLALAGEVLSNFVLKPLDVIYSDYVDPSLTYSVSALPGGPRTATWDEAQSVSPGQMIATAAGNLAPLVSGPAQTIAGLAFNEDFRQGFLSGEEVPWANLGDGVYDTAQREAAFEENGYGSWVSGSIGFGTSLVWDPLILAGPAAKVLRVSHQFGMGMGAIRGVEDLARQNELITIGRGAFAPYEEAKIAYKAAVDAGDEAKVAQWGEELATRKAAKDAAMKKQAPVVQFMNWVLDPQSGQRSWQEIEQHKLVRELGAPEQLVTSIHNAKTFDELSLIVRAVSDDMDAYRLLKDQSWDNYLRMRSLRLQRSIDSIFAAPDKLARKEADLERAVDDALSEVKRLEDEAMLVDTGWQSRVAAYENMTSAQRVAADVVPEDMAGSPARLQRQMMDEGNRRIDTLTKRLAEARADGAPTLVLEDLLRQLDEAAKLANDGLFGPATAKAFPAEARGAHRRLAQSLDQRNLVIDARNRGRAWTPAQQDEAARTLDELERKNILFRTALRAAESNTAMMTNRWFGRGRLQGLARSRESAFQRRAERRAYQMDTHRTGLKWIPKHFTAPGGQGVTVWSAVRGAGSLAQDAITRPFTYAAMESPAGWIGTDGLGGLDNYREIQATVNNLKSLSPEQRETILERFSRLQAVGDDGMTAVTEVEKDILRGIAMRYADEMGVTDVDGFMDDIKLMYKFFDAERADQIAMIRDRGFWVDEDGVINRAPFLETQLLNGTPLMDFRRLEGLVRDYARNYAKQRRPISSRAASRDAQGAERIAQARLRRAEERTAQAEQAMGRAEASGSSELIETARVAVEKSKATQQQLDDELKRVMSDSAKFAMANGTFHKSWDTSLEWYDTFQSVWRFGVLFRVGYPVRNSIDGVVRRIAYDASVVPVLVDGLKGTRNIASNIRTGRSALIPGSDALKNRKAAKALKKMESDGALPRSVSRWAQREQEKIVAFRDNQVDFRDLLRSSMDELEAARAGMPAGPTRDQLDLQMSEISQSIRSFDFVIDDQNARLLPFREDARPDEIIAAYRQSLDRPRKVGDEFIEGNDGRMYYGFRGDPRMAGIMEMNASARSTVQATLALRLSASRALAQAAVTSLGGEVLPTARNYWPELTKILNQQVGQSLVGRLFYQGKSADDIARAVMGSGDRAREFRTLHNIKTFRDAEDKIPFIVDELTRYVPNPELRRALSRGPVTEDQIRKMLDNDDFRSMLVPVHGAVIAPAVGHAPGVLQKFLNFSNKAFEVIGTMPEDAIVRLPFANRIYEKNLRIGLAHLGDRYGQQIPAWAVERVIQQARVRAIKDTKTFMYTQDRRTNFGRVGERFIPFVSAWQNSIVAYGRLVSRNPETLYMAEQAWRTPERLGIEDADGNIRIPVPEWAVGKTMYVPGVGDVPIAGTVGDSWVYDKGSLSVIADNIDPALTFKSGPVFQMAGSTLMQAGWVGPEAPPVMRAVFGEDTATKLWDAGVLATFGPDEYGRAATMGVLPFGVDKVLPAWGQKAVQVFLTQFGNTPENNSTYNTYYMNNARQMVLEFKSGARDTFPTATEIKDRTNGQFFIRGMSNLFGIGGPLGAVTPTQQQNEINEMQSLYFMFQDMYGQEADQHFMSLFGDEMSWLVNWRGSRSVAGAPANKRSLIRAQEHEDLIRAVAPGLNTKSMLSFILSDGNYQADSGDSTSRVAAWFGLLDPNSDSLDRYDPNVRLVQFLQEIPGTSENWRTALTPEESARQASIDAGWDLYFKANEAIYAELDAMGIDSLQSAAAAGLSQQRKEFVNSMAGDPVYAAWYQEYNQGFEQRTLDALTLLRSTTSNEKFMSGPGADAKDMWQAAGVWLDARRRYMTAVSSASDEDDTALRRGWELESAQLSSMNPRFRDFWSRYLDNDDLSVN